MCKSIGTCSIALAVLVAAGLGIAQEMGKGGQEMPAWPKPGPEHARLKAFEGTWDAVLKHWMEPGKSPSESKGTETSTLGCGGYWLITDHKSEMMGMPFIGHGAMGYDQVRKKYVGTWHDSMSSSMMVMEGAWDEASKSLTTNSEVTCPDGKMMKWKMVHAIKDSDRHVLSMYSPGPDGKDCLSMEISYTRRK